MTMFNATGYGVSRMNLGSLSQRENFMLCLWCDNCSIIHFEFLNSNQTLNAALYSQQL